MRAVQLVAPRFFATRLKDATHVLLDPAVPVTELKLAEFAAYEQHALSFDWAIDSARGKIGDRTELDYNITASPAEEPSVKPEPADDNKVEILDVQVAAGSSGEAGWIKKASRQEVAPVQRDQDASQRGEAPTRSAKR